MGSGDGGLTVEPYLHMLALILQLRRHFRDVVATYGRMTFEELRKDAGSRPVQADDKDFALMSRS